jgi:hypothetical protein
MERGKIATLNFFSLKSTKIRRLPDRASKMGAGAQNCTLPH